LSQKCQKLKEMNENDIIKNNYPEHVETIINIDVPKNQTLERLDVYLTRNVANASRSKVKKAIDDGLVTVNGNIGKASQKVKGNDKIICKIMKAPPIELVPENIPLEIIHEDDYLLVVNKPAGMCTHPGYGNRYGTLVNGLLFHLGIKDTIKLDDYDEDDEESEEAEGSIFASEFVRPGIVHRLDKDTSGLLVVAKNEQTLAKLSKQFAEHKSERHYYALVWGNPKEDKGTIESLIGRAPKDRKLYAVVKSDGKYAKTDFEVIERYNFATLLKLSLHTGRTHQIRVHMSHIKHPVWGDKSYGGDKIVYSYLPEINQIARKCLQMTNRQLLHAKTLGFIHPETQEFLKFESSLPDDFVKVLDVLSSHII